MASTRRNPGWAAMAVVAILMMLAAIVAPAQNALYFTTLHSFDDTDGAYPSWALVQATDGNLYGTAEGGGANYAGTVFKITTSGVLTTLYDFCPQGGNCLDGSGPSAPLLQATDGNFYGTTQFGGTNGYDGTVFSISPGGALTTIYRFCSESNCKDGYNPVAGLIQGTDGNFYSTTQWGGDGLGTAVKITPSGILTTLHSFCSVRDPQGDCADGSNPYAPLVQASDGNLYGTTWWGGANYGSGTVFKITPGGTLTTVHSFTSLEGEGIYAGLIQAADGNFYGTADGGGSGTNCSQGNGCGTVFRMTPDGTVTTLHDFNGAVGEGWSPYAALAQDTDGSFYGTTVMGGANDTCLDSCGTVFGLSAGLRPFVETVPTSGKAGVPVRILGNNLKGTTGVTFDRTPAVFKVISPTEIGATVPVGATSGTVQVTTPSGTLSSNVPFQVRP